MKVGANIYRPAIEGIKNIIKLEGMAQFNVPKDRDPPLAYLFSMYETGANKYTRASVTIFYCT